MKFLEIAALAQLTQYLSGVDSISGESRIFGRLEAYSCKIAGSDKKLFKSLETQYQVEISKSPETELSSSPFGPLTESSSRKTLIYLISLLNASFPDYDFCNVKPEQFRKETTPYMVINSINTILGGVISNYNTDLSPKLWQILETEMNLRECDIYSFLPDYDSDPYTEPGNIWSFNYFFYSKKLKRIVLFTCRSVSKFVNQPEDDESQVNLSRQESFSWMDEEMEL